MHKFGLLLVLANIILKLGLGIGLWKMAMEFKSGLSNSTKYNEEQIDAGNPEILRAQNNNQSAIVLSAVFEDGVKQTQNITYTSDNIFHLRFTYDPSIPNFTVYNVLTGKNVLTMDKKFKELNDITVTIGCSMFNEANPPYPYRYSNIEVYNFSLKKL